MATRVTSTRFVGRAAELAELSGAFEASAAGTPSLALVAGDRDIEADTIGVKDLSTGEQVDVATDAVLPDVLSRLGRG